MTSRILLIQFRHDGRAAMIGVGSGRDLLSAAYFGFRDITGIELNPIFVAPRLPGPTRRLSLVTTSSLDL
jgi:hypothetical protein